MYKQENKAIKYFCRVFGWIDYDFLSPLYLFWQMVFLT